MTGWGRQTRRLWSLVLIQTSLRAVAPETTQSSNLATSAVFSSYNNSTITADAGISSPVQNATAQNSAKRAADPEADAFLIPNQSQLVYTKINLPLTDNFWIGTCLYREVLEQQLLNFGSSPSRGRDQGQGYERKMGKRVPAFAVKAIFSYPAFDPQLKSLSHHHYITILRAI